MCLPFNHWTSIDTFTFNTLYRNRMYLTKIHSLRHFIVTQWYCQYVREIFALSGEIKDVTLWLWICVSVYLCIFFTDVCIARCDKILVDCWNNLFWRSAIDSANTASHGDTLTEAHFSIQCFKMFEIFNVQCLMMDSHLTISLQKTQFCSNSWSLNRVSWWVMPTSAKKLFSIPNETRQPLTNRNMGCEIVSQAG